MKSFLNVFLCVLLQMELMWIVECQKNGDCPTFEGVRNSQCKLYSLCETVQIFESESILDTCGIDWNTEELYVCCLSADQLEPLKKAKENMCGRPKSAYILVKNFLDGDETLLNAYPWVAAIKTIPIVKANSTKRRADRDKVLCGASLINRRYLLTAAHCFLDAELAEPWKHFYAILASHVAVGKNAAGKRVEFERIIIHPKYNRSLKYNDIALIRLKEDVIYDSQVIPVCLPTSEGTTKLNLTNRIVRAVGWGNTESSGRASRWLQEALLNGWTNEACEEKFLGEDNREKFEKQFPEGILDSMFCAGHPNGSDTCRGDSGGPLMVNLDGFHFIQIGITSTGYGCGTKGFPGIYARVDQFLDWIHENSSK